MKNKLLHIGTLVILSAGFYFLGWHSPTILTLTARLKIDESKIARLTIGGTEFEILTNTSLFNRNFIFLDNKTGNIMTTLSIENPVIEPPRYRIVKGHTHDWLVVTRIGGSGTGIMNHVDEWYIVGSSKNMKMVLSYPSQGYEVPLDGGKNKYWTTRINLSYLNASTMDESYPDDSAVDVKFTEGNCFIVKDWKDWKDKNCSESSRTDHYVWDNKKEEFALK